MTAAQWRVARVTPWGELAQPARITGTAVRLAAQVFLVTCLWRALYSEVDSSAGLLRDQAVTYAVLAVLATQIRGLDRSASRDMMLQHIQQGTILYWFLRPLPPRRYYLVRAVGEQAYGFVWVLAGYAICLAASVVTPAASPGAAAVFAVTLLCGQIIVYQLLLTVDLLSFWTLQNNAALMIVRFLQNLLSGAIAPLWFFPDWFLTASSLLPFRYTLDIPLSLYIGRLPVSDAPRLVAIQVLWCVLLALGNRLLWRKAANVVTVQGG
ncbi:ABC-2 family transporter protein [Actinomycetes bacterium KLBMP 9797]